MQILPQTERHSRHERQIHRESNERPDGSTQHSERQLPGGEGTSDSVQTPAGPGVTGL